MHNAYASYTNPPGTNPPNLAYSFNVDLPPTDKPFNIAAIAPQTAPNKVGFDPAPLLRDGV